MKKIIFITMLILSASSWAELPSWGMTEDQYKLPNFATKMNEIGEQAANNTWLLKITAPEDWHDTIRAGLTDSGVRDVQVNFKDSMYQSLAISATEGLKLANVSTTNSIATVQKQVIIDKPEIDTEIEAPVFEKIDIQNNTEALLENMEMSVPTAIKPVKIITTAPVIKEVKAPAEVITTTAVQVPVNTQIAEAEPEAVESETPATTPRVESAVISAEMKTEENKEDLRVKYARTKRVDKLLNYDNINDKDELFIQDDVVLIKRFVNQGVVLYFWMKESYNPSEHKLVDKGSGKYQKDPAAQSGDTNNKPQNQSVEEPVIEATNLDFVAVDSDASDQDDLRRDYARNKRVDVNMSAEQLKSGDLLFVKNKTVLVERPITSAQSAYYWLVGETTISLEVERKDDNRFSIK